MKPRERLLLVLVLWVGLFIWAGAVLEDFASIRNQWQAAKLETLRQQQVLAQSDEVETRLEAVRERLDPSRTYNGAQLASRVSSLAAQSGFDDYTSPTPDEQTSGNMRIHTLDTLSVENVSLKKLIVFDRKLKDHAPYLALETIEIRADRTDPKRLDAEFKISSFELNTSTLP